MCESVGMCEGVWGAVIKLLFVLKSESFRNELKAISDILYMCVNSNCISAKRSIEFFIYKYEIK